MSSGLELLTTLDQLWADILMQTLRENGIPCRAVPVYGAGLVVSAGVQEQLKVYVPGANLARAQSLMQDLLSPPDEE